MATEISQLMGEMIEDPDHQNKNIEALLHGFLDALIREQSKTEGAQ